MNKYQNVTQVQAIPEQPKPSEKEYLHTYQAAVGVPFSKAIVTGLLSGLAVFVMVWLFDGGEPWRWGLGVSVMVTLIRWVGGDWFWVLLAKAEKATGLDLNQDGQVGEEEITRIDVRQLTEDNNEQLKFMRLPCAPEKFLKLAIGIINRRQPFTMSEWAGKGKPFSDPQFRKLRAYLIQQGYVVQSSANGVNEGYVFNRNGVAILRDYLQQHGKLME